MKEKLTISLETYLVQIYLLQQENEEVRVTDVSRALQHTKPSVNRAIHTLTEKGYLLHELYGNIALTEKGLKVAENIHETQKVSKKFLVEILGVEEDVAEKEACQIAYIISKGTRKKMRKFMKKKL